MSLEKETETSLKNIRITIIIGYDTAPGKPDTPMVIKPLSGRQRCEPRCCRLNAMVATVFVSCEIGPQTKTQDILPVRYGPLIAGIARFPVAGRTHIDVKFLTGGKPADQENNEDQKQCSSSSECQEESPLCLRALQASMFNNVDELYYLTSSIA